MKEYKITFENKNYFYTGFNGSLLDVKNYYLNKYFNFGIEGDLMVKAVKVEVI